jgi:hypothetical protein
MSLRCKIGLHPWNGCVCSICGITRHEGHDWSQNCEECFICNNKRYNKHDYCRYCGHCKNCDQWDWHIRRSGDDCRKCKVCGRILRQDHDWDGCGCKNCYSKRDEQHDYSADCEECSKCYKKSGNKHSWDGCRCTKCTKLRQDVSDDQHNWTDDCEKCSKCGKTREFKHEWSYEKKVCLKCNKIGDEFTIFNSALDSNNSKLVDSLVKQGAKLGYCSKEDILNNAIKKSHSETVEVLLKNNYPITYYSLKYALKSDSLRIVKLLIKFGALDIICTNKKGKTSFIQSLIEYLSETYNREESFELVLNNLNYTHMQELLIYLIENPNRTDVKKSVIKLFKDYSQIIDTICQPWSGIYSDLESQKEVFRTYENTINELINIKTNTSSYILGLFVKLKKDISLCTVTLDGFAMNYKILSLSSLRNKAKNEIILRGNIQVDSTRINSEEAWNFEMGDSIE